MISLRPLRLTQVLVCLSGLTIAGPMLLAQQPQPNTPQPQQNTPQQTAPRQTPPPAPANQSNNPFENVPQATPAAPANRAPVTPPTRPLQTAPAPAPGAPPPVQAPQFETPAAPPVNPAPGAKLAPDVIEAIEFRGSRRVPQDTLRALIFSRKGDVFNEDTLRRDFMALWNTNRFDDIRLETERGEDGGLIVRFVLTERRMIRNITYPGLKSASISDVLDALKERKVGMVQESMYDPNVINRAAVVIKSLLADRGHQFATVTPELHQVPPTSLEVAFVVNEGPKVSVGKITIVGNKAFSRREVINAMKNLKPIGIPHSIFFEELFPKTFDEAKLEEDKERIRDAYGNAGYAQAKVLDQTLNLRATGGAHGQFHIPLFKENHIGSAEDITLPVEEGRKYYLGKMDFTGVKLFRSTDFLTYVFGLRPGMAFSNEKMRNGMKNLTKLYEQYGYIDYVGEPETDFVPNSDKINITMNVDEGKQFFIRRIDFTGNTTTRDKVIRRELLLDEGDAYNSNLWDLSILRLNQLGYFETLKENESYELKRNGDNTVDITLKVRERGRNSISLNGGVSGISGSFVGLNYSTNNFLGLGETLSLGGQVGTLMTNISAGFTEPYLFDRPFQVGFQVYLRRYAYNQGVQESLLSGQDVTAFYNALGSANVLNYVQNSKGISLSFSYPLKRTFARLGLSIGYDDSSIRTESIGASNYFTYLNFQGVAGPNSLSGIKTAKIIPSYSYNTRNNYLNPTAGASVFASVELSGSVLGANVNMIRPTLDIQYYHRSPKWPRNVIAFHFLGSTEIGYGGKVVPPFARTFLGGENDVRGFEFFEITPVAYLPSSAAVPILNPDGSTRVQKTLIGGHLVNTPTSVNVPLYQIITPGGDTQAVANLEYRIPIVGPVTLSPFLDIGMNKILYPNQLKVNSGQVTNLNNQFPAAGFTDKVVIAPGTQAIRSSVGVELSVVLPIVQAPFRVYWAYNPTTVQEWLQGPIVWDPSTMVNPTSVVNAISTYNRAFPDFEKKNTFRFTIGRTF
jgi:outer membrane protein insertion porin family